MCILFLKDQRLGQNLWASRTLVLTTCCAEGKVWFYFCSQHWTCWYRLLSLSRMRKALVPSGTSGNPPVPTRPSKSAISRKFTQLMQFYSVRASPPICYNSWKFGNSVHVLHNHLKFCEIPAQLHQNFIRIWWKDHQCFVWKSWKVVRFFKTFDKVSRNVGIWVLCIGLHC